MIRLIIYLSGLVILYSCGNKNKIPTGILMQDKMQAVLWDVIRADAFTEEFIKKDTSKNAVTENLKLQQQIFAIHKVTREDFYNSYDYYKKNTAVFKIILDSIIARNERNTKINLQPLILD